MRPVGSKSFRRRLPRELKSFQAPTLPWSSQASIGPIGFQVRIVRTGMITEIIIFSCLILRGSYSLQTVASDSSSVHTKSRSSSVVSVQPWGKWMSVYVNCDSHDSHEEALVLATEISRCAMIVALASNGRIGLIRRGIAITSALLGSGGGAFFAKGGGAFFGRWGGAFFGRGGGAFSGWCMFMFSLRCGGAFFGGGCRCPSLKSSLKGGGAFFGGGCSCPVSISSLKDGGAFFGGG